VLPKSVIQLIKLERPYVQEMSGIFHIGPDLLRSVGRDGTRTVQAGRQT